jgi:hypothetical protein
MSKRWILMMALVAGVLVSAAAAAKGAWSHTVTHRYSGKTSIKITEPKGMSVTVTVGEEVKKDTIPAIITLADEDRFVPVTITAKDGHTWAEKIEVRAKQQTALSVNYTAPPKATPAQKAKKKRRYAGTLASAAGKSCGKKWRGRDIKLELIDVDSGDATAAHRFSKDSTASMEIPAGTYDVRAYVKYKGGLSYYDTKTATIGKDGWVIGFGCKKGSRGRPSVLVK